MAPTFLDPAQAYNLWSDAYEEGPNPMIALSNEILRTWPTVPSSLLEIGCGTGRNLLGFRGRGTSALFGVDVSPGMLEVARERLPEASLWCMDARQGLPLAASSVDFVLVTLVLEHLEDPGPVFREAARVLSQGGTLLILELHPVAFDAGSKAHFEGENGEVFYTSSYRHDAEELMRCAAAAGLDEGECKDVLPNKALEARFPSRRRPSGTPWMLQGMWRKSDMA